LSPPITLGRLWPVSLLIDSRRSVGQNCHLARLPFEARRPWKMSRVMSRLLFHVPGRRLRASFELATVIRGVGSHTAASPDLANHGSPPHRTTSCPCTSPIGPSQLLLFDFPVAGCLLLTAYRKMGRGFSLYSPAASHYTAHPPGG